MAHGNQGDLHRSFFVLSPVASPSSSFLTCPSFLFSSTVDATRLDRTSLFYFPISLSLHSSRADSHLLFSLEKQCDLFDSSFHLEHNSQISVVGGLKGVSCYAKRETLTGGAMDEKSRGKGPALISFIPPTVSRFSRSF